ncbi:MAG: FCD domain-containing protein [Propionibacteriales bacterium]|nr:FCD domain-containing protein [Propionibacteriales bacterium]
MVDARQQEMRSGPPQSKTAYVVDRLREEIAAGIIVPGGALRQTQIAMRYGVSPTPVREALRILEAAGTISYAPNRGATVREMDPVDGDDLYSLRAEIEGFACRLGVERQDGTLATRLEELADRLEAEDPATGPAQRYQLNRDLHFLIFDAGSQVVSQQVASLWEAFTPAVTVWGVPQIAERLNADHRQIIKAVRKGDAELAGARMREHVLNARMLRRKYIG